MSRASDFFKSGDGIVNTEDLGAGAVTVDKLGAGAVTVDKLGADSVTQEKVHPDVILGTVSQSGGVPTGAIIERGSNANGEYVRYADGTQICTINTRLIYSAGVIYYLDLPATFDNTTHAGISSGVQPSIANAYERLEWLNSNSQIAFKSKGAAVDPGNIVRFTVIGRWY